MIRARKSISVTFLFILFSLHSFVLPNVSGEALANTCISDPGIAAFPGAEGYGAKAVGGRCGQILEVTTLEDYGRGEAKIPGSLRAAIETKGPRIIVFRVGGVIHLKDRLIVKKSNLTIAGQTAPGDGITIRGHSGIVVMAEDIIIRHIKVRLNATSSGSSGEMPFGIRNGSHRVIVDHCSGAFVLDKNLAGTDEDLMKNNPLTHFMEDITYQRCIFSDSFKTALLMTGPNNYVADPQNPDKRYLLNKNFSVHHNLFVSNHHRNPLITNGGTEVINNVVYNWRSWAAGSSAASRIDYINNYYKPGPWTNTNDVIIHSSFTVPKHHPDGVTVYELPKPSLFLSGNIVEGVFEDYLADNWDIRVVREELASRRSYWQDGHGILNRDGEFDKNIYGRFAHMYSTDPSPYPVTVLTGHAAYNSVLNDAGDNAGLDCTGNWVARQDEVDERAINDVITRDGIDFDVRPGPGKPDAIDQYVDYLISRGLDANLLADVHGEGKGIYPLVHPDNSNPCDDSDGDGMPDQYENLYSNFLDSTDAADGNMDEDGDGYTNIEEFLNGTAPAGSYPVADVSDTPTTTAIVGVRLLFDGRNSFDPDGDIVDKVWDFGHDDRTANQTKVWHTFDRAGDYTVTYTVTDATGQSDTASMIVSIVDPSPTPPVTSNQPPVAQTTWGDVTINVGDSVTFDGRHSYDADGNIALYSWDFGDGSLGLGRRVEHVYSEPGTFIAKITVTDAEGEVSTNTDNTRIITVNP